MVIEISIDRTEPGETSSDDDDLTESSSSDWDSNGFRDSSKPGETYRRGRRRPSRGEVIPVSTNPKTNKTHTKNVDEKTAPRSLKEAPLPESQSQDATVHLDLDVAFDPTQDVKQLSRLNQLGHFNEATALFKERLATHVDFFPVTAEYADLLLEQGRFGEAEAFITARLRDMAPTFTPLELRLLTLLKSFAEIYTKGALIAALQTTRRTLVALEKDCANHPFLFKSSMGQHIHLVETCLRIVAFAATHSSYLGCFRYILVTRWGFSSDRFVFPGSPLRFDPSRAGHLFQTQTENIDHEVYVPDLGDWYFLLVQEGYLWESHRLLQAVVSLLGMSDRRYLPNGVFERFFHLTNITEAKDFFFWETIGSPDKDQQLLTELANATLLAGFLNSQGAGDSVQSTSRHLFKKARGIAAKIASLHPNLLKSRPYLNWLYLAETESPTLHDGASISHSEPIFPLVWCRDFMGSIQTMLSAAIKLAPGAGGLVIASATSTGSQERNLKTIMAVAKEQGDYRLQVFLLQVLLNNCDLVEGKRDIIRDTAQLRRDVMSDAAGYLDSLFAEWRFLLQLNLNASQETLTSFCSRLAEFNDSHPSHFDLRPEERPGLTILPFDLPILVWIRHQIMEQVLLRLNRRTEAEVIGLRSARARRHLPCHAIRLNAIFTPCMGCEDCVRYDYPAQSTNYSYIWYSSTSDRPGGDYRYRLPSPARRRSVSRRRRHDRSQSPLSPSPPRSHFPYPPALGHEGNRYSEIDDEILELEDSLRRLREDRRYSLRDRTSHILRERARESARGRRSGMEDSTRKVVNITSDRGGRLHFHLKPSQADSFETTKSFLRQAADKASLKLIDAGQFKIVDSEDQVVSESNWNGVVRAGKRLRVLFPDEQPKELVSKKENKDLTEKDDARNQDRGKDFDESSGTD